MSNNSIFFKKEEFIFIWKTIKLFCSRKKLKSYQRKIFWHKFTSWIDHILWVFVWKFGDDGFHFEVISQTELRIFSSLAGHFEATEGSLCVENIVAIDPATENYVSKVDGPFPKKIIILKNLKKRPDTNL